MVPCLSSPNYPATFFLKKRTLLTKTWSCSWLHLHSLKRKTKSSQIPASKLGRRIFPISQDIPSLSLGHQASFITLDFGLQSGILCRRKLLPYDLHCVLPCLSGIQLSLTTQWEQAISSHQWLHRCPEAYNLISFMAFYPLVVTWLQ